MASWSVLNFYIQTALSAVAYGKEAFLMMDWMEAVFMKYTETTYVLEVILPYDIFNSM